MVAIQIQGKATNLDKNENPKKRLEEAIHPCSNAKKNTVIHTADGDIMCLQKSEKELESQLEKTGGYNRRYLAATLNEAKKDFRNMFRIYGKDYLNTTDWQRWRSGNISAYLSDKIVSHVKPVPIVDVSVVKVRKLHNSRKRHNTDDNKRQRRSNDDFNIEKREVNVSGINIQCLPGGRVTEKGNTMFRMSLFLNLEFYFK
jgi:hypothetical protein